MSDYEFWKDLGNIFDAILTYQKKNVEFNNRFINPWIRLGNIFDREDQHKEAVQAYQHAVEIDPDSSQNWADLGDAQFKMGAYDDAISAYKKAIELDPKAGWPVSNLALTLVTLGQCEEAIPLYMASIDLFTEDKDKAVSWNRLGNAYRKLNDYENAFLAFQKADEFDGENTGFRDQLDETTETSAMVAPEETLVQMGMDDALDVNAPVAEVEPEAAAELPQVETVALADQPVEPVAIASDAPVDETKAESETATELPQAEAVIAAGIAENEAAVDLPNESVVASSVEANAELPVTESVAAPTEEETATVAEEVVEPDEPEAEQNWPPDDTEIHEVVLFESKNEPLPAWLENESLAAQMEDVAADEIQSEESAVEQPSVVEAPVNKLDNAAFNTSSTSMEVVETYTEFTSTSMVDLSTLEDTQPVRAVKKAAVESVVSEETVVETAIQPEVQQEADVVEQNAPVMEKPAVEAESFEVQESSNAEAAYEEYLKDAVEPVSTLSDHLEEVHAGAPVTKVSESGDVRIAMDTQNAHVWNELGNVYFNAGSCDDAISAYGKAIELDRQFAWPYSNLALAYVQKERFAEAILLYQRSIELFALDKDKAVTWNRLGNVYRRLNDYDNAIAAYQTADDLDPDNATLSLRSHYGLLGNLNMEQKPNYVL